MYEVLKIDSVAKNINDLTFTDFYYRLMLLARALFKWENLPNGIDEKWIERYLFSEGRCIFFFDDKLGFFVTRCTVSGGINCNNEPITISPVTTGVDVIENYDYLNFTGRKIKQNLFTFKKLPKQAVLIKNNDVMMPTADTLRLFAYRLTEIQRTIDINIEAQKTPILVTVGSDKEKTSLKTVYRQYKGNEPSIYVDKDLNKPLAVLKTDAPIVFDKLQIQKHAVWNEVCTFLGINNANMDKRERLVAGEVQANNEQIELSAHTMLKARQKACELINSLYPELNVSVSLRTEKEFKEKLSEVGASND